VVVEGRAPRHRRSAAQRRTARHARRLSRAERRHAVELRRAQVALAGAIVGAVVALAAWFPGGALLHERAALAATRAQLRQLDLENKALKAERQKLDQPAEIDRLARQQYEMVRPGQTAYEVLPAQDPGSGSKALYPGDPALQPVVSPSASQELPPDSLGSDASGASVLGAPAAVQRSTTRASSPDRGRSRAASSRSPGLLGRMLETLEFWRQ